ncbi:GTP-binding [Fusarium albosuccineum]|uniref:GTP-binding n=1 Tax=Fusarium albosuccineum TaxID=1237068 RepID=A0A8H4L626_9HYPO|nr:GTP-binding [Fusarium albosuccineum]
MAQFIPRQAFAVPNSIPKTYYLGHHAAGQAKIVKTLSNISLILECRDFRLPLSTHNPQLERALAGRERVVVYTKFDLGTDSPHAANALRKLYGDRLVFWDKSKASTTKSLLKKVKDVARAVDSLTGMRAMIVGMPNVGKSTLLNALRRTGTPERTAKVAKTGDQAGVTRKVGTPVRILESEAQGGVGDGAFVLDTPGIFQPYVDDGETMIKIALVQGIKKGLIPDEILADYLLYRINLLDPAMYERYCGPTNEVEDFLTAVAKKEGKLKVGGLPNWQDAAARVLSQWRSGNLGRFVLDDLSDDAVHEYQTKMLHPKMSMNQAKKQQKQARAQEKAGA